MLLCFMIVIGMTGCQSLRQNKADVWWKEAKSEENIREYVTNNHDKLDMEELQKIASDESSTLSQQFRAVILMCELEYQNNMAESDGEVLTSKDIVVNDTLIPSQNNTDIFNGIDVFSTDYPVSAPYADSFLAQIEVDKEAFWDAMEKASHPFNYFMPLLAATESVSPETAVLLTTDFPEGLSFYEDQAVKAVNTWLSYKAEHLPVVGDALREAGFFKNQDFRSLDRIYLSDEAAAKSIDDGLAYIKYMKDSMIPMLEQEFPDDSDQLKQDSRLLAEPYFDTGLTISVPESLDLSEESKESEVIELEGKKVIGFYHNPYQEEFQGSPRPVRILGDFMMTLPAEQAAATVDEADYYLVLTPSYTVGEQYKDRSGNDLDVEQVYSFTSVDLYEAESKMLLRHLGVVKESPSDGLLYQIGEELDPYEYPKLVSAETLTFIYQNINQPETFNPLLDHGVAGESQLSVGEAVWIDGWQFVMESYDVVPSFEAGNYRYDASEGNQLVRCYFHVTNNRDKQMTLLPMMYYIGQDLSVWIRGDGDQTYESTRYLTYSDGLNGSQFEPGEAKSGYIIFDVPSSVVENENGIMVELSLRPQSAVYLLQ